MDQIEETGVKIENEGVTRERKKKPDRVILFLICEAAKLEIRLKTSRARFDGWRHPDRFTFNDKLQVVWNQTTENYNVKTRNTE